MKRSNTSPAARPQTVTVNIAEAEKQEAEDSAAREAAATALADFNSARAAHDRLSTVDTLKAYGQAAGRYRKAHEAAGLPISDHGRLMKAIPIAVKTDVADRVAAKVAPRMAGPTVGKLNSKQRRKHRQGTPRKLTGRQLEVIQAFADCESNYSRTAKRVGLSNATVRQHVKAAYKKLGQQVPKKSGTKSLPGDHRGSPTIAAGSRPEATGDGKDRGGRDRRRD